MYMCVCVCEYIYNLFMFFIYIYIYIYIYICVCVCVCVYNLFMNNEFNKCKIAYFTEIDMYFQKVLMIGYFIQSQGFYFFNKMVSN